MTTSIKVPDGIEISGTTFPPAVASGIPAGNVIIAAVIEWRNRIALFKTSSRLGHDSGLWNCITGTVEANTTPEQQVREELFEESGLQANDLLELRQGPTLVIADENGTPWLVHPFTAVTGRRRLEISGSHICYRWTTVSKAKRFTNRVNWLDTVLNATGHMKSDCSRLHYAIAPPPPGGIETMIKPRIP